MQHKTNVKLNKTQNHDKTVWLSRIPKTSSFVYSYCLFFRLQQITKLQANPLAADVYGFYFHVYCKASIQNTFLQYQFRITIPLLEYI